MNDLEFETRLTELAAELHTEARRVRASNAHHTQYETYRGPGIRAAFDGDRFVLRPWATFIDGTAGAYFATLGEAAEYLKRKTGATLDLSGCSMPSPAKEI